MAFSHRLEDLFLAGEELAEGLAVGDLLAPAAADVDFESGLALFNGVEGAVADAAAAVLQTSGSISSTPSSTLQAFMGQTFTIWHFLQPLQLSSSNWGTSWPMMPRSLRVGLTQLLGQPPQAILNLWGSLTLW